MREKLPPIYARSPILTIAFTAPFGTGNGIGTFERLGPAAPTASAAANCTTPCTTRETLRHGADDIKTPLRPIPLCAAKKRMTGGTGR
jgi:hypothetical protein